MRKNSHLLWALLPVLASAGCASAAQTADTGGIAMSDDVSAFLNAMCARLEECSAESPLFASRDGCIKYFVTQHHCGEGMADARLDELTACVSGLGETSCTDIVAQLFAPHVCAATLASFERAGGDAWVGEVCGDDTACVSGVACASAGNAICGVCEARPAEGEACNGDCGSSALFCNAAGKCQLRGSEGDECNSREQCFSEDCSPEGKCVEAQVGDECDRQKSCGEALRCLDGKCAPLAKVGEPCTSADDDEPVCTYEAACIKGRCSPIASCGRGKLGDVCSSNAQCDEGLGCTPDGERCATRPTEGESCSIYDVACAVGFRCQVEPSADSGTCVKITPETMCE